ncbi:uncharacterized protein LOC111027613 [Myzus persicae]|uniref:uncharacterized protein LOC111027613 n=1 Tax=Myzus persicae TaxID=13164 RepID=UPI000B9367CF|nr:uncharacterized protein LOC111027613 [Myzus persicae]
MYNTPKFQNLQRRKKEAEIRLALFITEHNISLRTSDHLVQLVKTLAPESEVLKNVSCNRTKATSIVKNVVGKHAFEILVDKMKKQYFSIIIDESTDKSSIKHLAIIVRMVDNDRFVVKDEFACLQEISNATANSVFEEIMNFFKNNNIPYQDNLIGFASDGAASMFGINHSVKTLLENEVNGIFVMKCVCHSLALCASCAAEKIPNYVEDLVREVYVYMKYSFKRQTEFSEFQKFVETKPHKLLHPSQTRWLSLHSSVKRTIEQYQALKLYFQGQYLIDKKAEQIFSNHQMYKRFPFNSDHMKLLKSMSVLDPKNIKNTISVAPIVANFPKLNININDIDREWRMLRNHDLNFNLELMDFWKTVKDLKNGDNLEAFSSLTSFVSYILTLPHSSASVERLFSSINLNKTKIRNRISTETMSGILHSKNLLSIQAQHCYEFNISSDMVHKHSYKMYK